MTALLAHDPVVAGYRTCFASLDWSVVERWEAQQSPHGRPGHPMSAYLKALLILDLGFRLALDPSQPYGFDVEQTLPTRFWLGEVLRHLDRDLLTALLASTVQALYAEIPG